MIFLLIPFALIELYLSLKTGEEIGFLWSVVWIVLSFMVGMALLQKSQHTMLGHKHSMKLGKLDVQGFQNASMAYFVGAILLIIPGVFSDFLGLLALCYTLYLQIVAKITPKYTKHNFKQQGDDNVIDVEIIDEHDRGDRST